jgi:hypothetical protein
VQLTEATSLEVESIVGDTDRDAIVSATACVASTSSALVAVHGATIVNRGAALLTMLVTETMDAT